MGKKAAMIFGWIFVVLGVLGFIPNPLVGEGALFHTDANHDIIHLLFGVILLWVAYKKAASSAKALKVLGVVSLLLAVIGLLDGNSILGLAEINGADNWLHIVLGVALLWVGMKAGKRSMAPAQNM